MAKFIKGRELIKSYYEQEDVAKEYIDKRFSTPSGKAHHFAQVGFVNRVIEEHNPKMILELAPGPARLSRYINFNGIAVGLDRSAAMLKIARKVVKSNAQYDKWNFVLGDAFSLPFKSKSFDMIYTFRFIRHFPLEERKKIYKECFRVLSDNGILLFDGENWEVVQSMRNKAGMVQPPVYDELFTPDELAEEAKANKFTQTIIEGNFHCPELLRRLNSLEKFKLGLPAYIFDRIFNSIMRRKPMEWLVVWKKSNDKK